MGRPRLQHSTTSYGRKALQMRDYIAKRNEQGVYPTSKDIFRKVRGVNTGNFQAIKSYYRRHLMTSAGDNIMFVKGHGYVVSGSCSDTQAWVFTQRMPKVYPQILNMAVASTLGISTLKAKGNKRDVEEAQAISLHLTRLVEDVTSIRERYDVTVSV